MKETSKSKLGMKKPKFSLRLQVMSLCMISGLVIAAAIGMTSLPSIVSIVKENTTNHMMDFLVDHGEKINNSIEQLEERIENLELSYKQASGYADIGSKEEVPMGEGPKDVEVLKDVESQVQGSVDSSSDNQYQMLQNQIDRYATQGETEDIILITDANGKILVSSNESYVGESLSEEEKEQYFAGEGSIQAECIKNGENSVTIAYSKAVYVDGTFSGCIVYYTSSKEIDAVLDDYTLTGIPAPRVILIDRTGLIIAHTIDESIGTTTGSEVLHKALAKLNSEEGLSTEPQYDTYIFQGEVAGMTYLYMPEFDWILVVSTLESEVYSSVTKIYYVLFINVCIIIAIIAIAVFFAARTFTKPIEYVNHVIGRIAKLDFALEGEEAKYRKIIKRNDEIGEIAKALATMIDEVKHKLELVNESSTKVSQAALQLQDITTDISEKANDTSAITQQLSAGMEETTASTDIIATDIKDVKDHVGSIREQVGESTAQTFEIMERAGKLKEDALEADKRTRDTFEEIKNKGAAAMEQSKAVNKINDLTQAIMEIADQTSLLALNASIEAARAGESGRGFAVVAGEIGSLAQQSSDTVGKITEIVKNVNDAVKNIVSCLADSQQFVETNVYSDYENLLNILDTYGKDAQDISNIMNKIDGSTDQLVGTIDSITQSIQAINQTMQESTIGVTDIAQRNGSIGELTAQSFEMVKETNGISEELEESIHAFKL